MNHPIRTGTALTPRQSQCLTLLAAGHTIPEIAVLLGVKATSVPSYVEGLRHRLGARNTAHAVAIGYRTGLLTLEA